MLDEKDLQAIGKLLDKQSDKFDEKFDDLLSVVNEGFTGIQEQITELKEEMAKRPTKTEVFGWADKRLIDLEIRKERHDYLHINELDKLPSPSEINRTLIERGFKQKLA